MLIDRLIFGTARITGGADARASRAVLERVLAAGICHIDTAPPYGLGTAEAVVGDVLADRPDIRITTKIGLPRPSHGVLRSYLKRMKRLMRPSPATLRHDYPPAMTHERNFDADFGLSPMWDSFKRSRDLLRRERIDNVLLHDAFRGDATCHVLDLLDKCAADGSAGAVGYATGAPFDTTIDDLFPSRWTAQVAPPVAWIGQYHAGRTPLILHSLAKTWLHAKRSDPTLESAMAHAAIVAGAIPGDSMSAELALLYHLAAGWYPEAQLIFATTNAGRLAAFLAAARHIEQVLPVAELLAAFDAGRTTR